MKNQLSSMPSSTSSPHKHDKKLRSVVLAVKNPPKYNSKLYLCNLCNRVFLTPHPHTLGGHRTTTPKEDQDSEKQQKNHKKDHDSKNGTGTSHSKSPISKGKNKAAVVAEDLTI